MIRVPPRPAPGFCAECSADTEDLALGVGSNGRIVYLCSRCHSGELGKLAAYEGWESRPRETVEIVGGMPRHGCRRMPGRSR